MARKGDSRERATRKRRGPQALPPHLRRTQAVTAWMQPVEASVVQAVARSKGLSVSEFCRQVILAALEQERVAIREG